MKLGLSALHSTAHKSDHDINRASQSSFSFVSFKKVKFRKVQLGFWKNCKFKFLFQVSSTKSVILSRWGFVSFKIHYMDFPDCLLLLWAYPSFYFLVFFCFYTFLVVGSVR